MQTRVGSCLWKDSMVMHCKTRFTESNINFQKGKVKLFGCLNTNAINVLLTKRKVKMAGCWPSSPFVFSWT